ncbi:MAG: DUF4384 domain-containing protein [Bryobacteraceae bacterium]
MRTLLSLAAVLGVTACVAQQPPPAEGARELFFAGAAPKDDLPPVRKPAAPAKAAQATVPPAAQPGRAASGSAVDRAAALRAMHLGLRYNLLLVRARGERGQPVAPERNFRKGDCVAIELEANRSGYLYVLSKQSGGDWVPLFPTPELSDQSNRIDPGQVIRTPKGGCFEIDDPPGKETLFVVLSRDPRDIYELSDGIKGPGDRPQPSSGPTQIASAGRINSAVDKVAEEFGTRDLPFKEVVKPAAQPAPVHKAAAKPADKPELEHAVYVVNGSTKPSSTLVTKIEILHN